MIEHNSEKKIVEQLDRVVVHYSGGTESCHFDNEVTEVELIEYID